VRLQSWGYQAEWINRSSLAELEPALLLEPHVERAAFFPDEAWIDAPGYTRRMLRLAASHGADVLLGQEVVAIERAGGAVAGVVLQDGARIAGDIVVNCAGPQADRIAALVDRELPLAPTTGLIVRIGVDHLPLARILHAPDLNLHPDGDRTIMLAHGQADAAIAAGEPPARWATTLLTRARARFPTLGSVLSLDWGIGVRPIPSDDRTCAGMVSSIPGYAEVVTHSAVTLAPLLARLIAAEIQTGAVDACLEPFRPERFDRPAAG
jgi:glycine/D-amino acid oxidase-like deaminating enzyme